MLTFLFEEYGYYPKDFSSNSFIIDNWKFSLMEIDVGEKEFEEICNYVEIFKNEFNNIGPYIIKTKKGMNYAFYDGKRYALICIYNKEMSVSDLYKFNSTFIDNQIIDLNKLKETWKDKMANVENTYMSGLRIDSVYYENNIKGTMFCLGLVQNAIQYLNDLIYDYGGSLNNIAIVHKRLKNLDSYDFFNPFNMIEDHYSRDIISLYQNDYVGIEEVNYFLNKNINDLKEATYVLARMMYYCDKFDEIETNYYKKDLKFNLDINIEKEIIKIKKIYRLLKERFPIRSIDWLED